jgi:hypothetical protein
MELHLILLSELPMHRSESGLFSREFLVEVADVAGRFLDAKVKLSRDTSGSVAQKDTHDLGEVRRWNPLVDYIIPVDVFEKGMAFNFLCVSFTRAQPPGWIPCQ